MKTEILTSKDYNEVTELMNSVFTVKNGYLMDLEKELPKMCVADDEQMNKYVAIRENGKIVASVGIYPLKANVCGIPVMFSTVGNVVTHESARGKGYMNTLMTEAMKHLDTLGIDASRLGGNRQRYNRFGYELSGLNYSFTISSNTTKAWTPSAEIYFEQLSENDTDALKKINDIHIAKPFYIQRCENEKLFGIHQVLSAWRNLPHIAKDSNGNIIGYISVTKDKTKIDDIGALNNEYIKDIVFAWQKSQNNSISVDFPAHRYELINYFCANAQQMSMYPPCNFKIINFEKVCDAFMKLKKSYMPNLPDGEGTIEIKDYGTLVFFSKDGICGCKKTNAKNNITFDKLSATRYIFSNYTPHNIFDENIFLKMWLPLPLGWNTLDRV